MLLGLTGKYCAGKNHVAKILEKKDFCVLDVDKLGHAAIEMCKKDIATRFTEKVQNEDGSIDRRALGKIAFASEKNLAFLQEIVHPVANRLTIEWVQEKKGKNCVVNAALLHESVLFDKLDGIIIVTAPFFTRLLRAKKRDGLSVRAVLQRFASQKNFFAQYRRANADIYRVGNFGLSFFDGFNGPCGVKRAKGLKAKLEVKIDAVLSAVEHSLKQRQGF